MKNPLLDYPELPPFDVIEAHHVEPGVDTVLADNRREIAAILSDEGDASWTQTLLPLEELDDRLHRVWSPVVHLHNVADNKALRDAYGACLPKISDYATEMGQNEALYNAYKHVRSSAQFETLGGPEQKSIENALRDFRLTGAELGEPERARFKQIKQQLAQVQNRFEENLLDATHKWNKHIDNVEELAGLPDSALALAQQTAAREDKSGYLLTLEYPSYLPVMMYASNRDLRFEVYQAFVTRASAVGPLAGRWDNSPLMQEILQLRGELATLLGFDNFAEYSLATKMAGDAGQVMDFLKDLAARSNSVAKSDLAELREFAKADVETLEAWDFAFYSEQLKQHKYSVSQEELRPFFPVERVLRGLFTVVQRLYGLEITAQQGFPAWNEQVSFYEVRDATGDLRGHFYLDLYSRPHKRGGAWMDECIVRRATDHGIQHPVAYLNCNFAPALGATPPLLTHDEVITLFHEFGHGLHHLLTKIDRAAVAGINGVAWDAVELPSQFMENWCWEYEALQLISGHYETGQPIDRATYDRMLAGKNFQSGLQMLRQIEFGLFDLTIHINPDAPESIQAILDQVRAEIGVVTYPKFNRFQNGFSHIFAGGYAAGYYSYKWAEVLAADAFSKFEKQGIFDRETGEQFLHCVLEQGGAREPLELFVDFQGREPELDALLRRSGIAA